MPRSVARVQATGAGTTRSQQASQMEPEGHQNAGVRTVEGTQRRSQATAQASLHQAWHALAGRTCGAALLAALPLVILLLLLIRGGVHVLHLPPQLGRHVLAEEAHVDARAVLQTAQRSGRSSMSALSCAGGGSGKAAAWHAAVPKAAQEGAAAEGRQGLCPTQGSREGGQAGRAGRRRRGGACGLGAHRGALAVARRRADGQPGLGGKVHAFGDVKAVVEAAAGRGPPHEGRRLGRCRVWAGVRAPVSDSSRAAPRAHGCLCHTRQAVTPGQPPRRRRPDVHPSPFSHRTRTRTRTRTHLWYAPG